MLVIPEKVVPNAEARSAIWEANMVNDVLLRNATEIIRNLDMVCDSKSFASRVWNEIVYSTRVGGKKSTRKCSSGAASGTNGKTAITTRMPFTERMRARWTSCLPKQSN